MRLTDEQITACARGCLRTRREDNGLFLDRMTDTLLDFYGSAAGSDTRAHCNAGVRLHFTSDTSALRVSLRYGRFARKVYAVDLRVDSGDVQRFGPDEETEAWTDRVFTADTRELRTFELWMPYVVETWIDAVEIDDDASFEPVPSGPVTWLAMGDSITQGMTCAGPTITYPAAAALALGVELHNIGVGGARMHRDVGLGVQPIDCTFATVAYGVNDWNGSKTLEDYRADSTAVIEGLLAGREDLPVGLMTPLPVFGRPETNEHGATLDDFRQVLRDIAAERDNITIIEGTELLENAPDRFCDGVHPNDLGMTEIASALAERLHPLIP